MHVSYCKVYVFSVHLLNEFPSAGDGHAGVAMSNPEDAHTEEDEDDHKQKLRSQDNTSGTNFIKRNIEVCHLDCILCIVVTLSVIQY